VLEGNALGGRFGLLGMSFLNRTDMRREGETLTPIKRFLNIIINQILI
jgi:hypothetical protein